MTCARVKKNSEAPADLSFPIQKELSNMPNKAKEENENISRVVVDDYNIILKFLNFKSSKLDSSGVYQFSIDWPNRNSSDLESITLFSDNFSPNRKLQQAATVNLPVSASQKIEKLTLKLLDSNNCLGQVIIPIAVLYLGLEDINGWYPIYSIRGECLGQLMTDICFSEPLKMIFRKKIRSKQTQEFKMDEKLELRNHHQPDLDTWKWNGSGWQHQSLQIVDSSRPNNNNILRKSIHQTALDELDSLQNLIRSIGVSAKEKVLHTGMHKVLNY
jgi:hypothetical protein